MGKDSVSKDSGTRCDVSDIMASSVFHGQFIGLVAEMHNISIVITGDVLPKGTAMNGNRGFLLPVLIVHRRLSFCPQG